MERNNISLFFTFQSPISRTTTTLHTSNYSYMKYNHHNIDFFSSPNSKFICFTDIKHPPLDIHPHDDSGFDSFLVNQDKKISRKLSFNHTNTLDPILPFGIDFFDQKLQQCDQQDQDYSQNKHHLQINDNSIMIDTHYNPTYSLIKSPINKPKQPDFSSNPHTMHFDGQDMPYLNSTQLIQPKLQTHQSEIYTTPRRRTQLFSAKKSCESTAEKSLTRNNEKGLRRLSNLAYSIVSQSSTTTYKQVAERLLSHLNFNSTDLEDEDGADRSSMQNVKRRVYDSLNVLLALGVIKRVGSKIAKQKQRKPFTTETSPDLQRYNEMLGEYNQRLKGLQARRRTQVQLRQKLQVFRETIDRNRRRKQMMNRGRIIRLPFLVFVSEQEGVVEWQRRMGEKKKLGKREREEKGREKEEEVVKVRYRGCLPQGYGDLDFVRLLGGEGGEREKNNGEGHGQDNRNEWYGQQMGSNMGIQLYSSRARNYHQSQAQQQQQLHILAQQQQEENNVIGRTTTNRNRSDDLEEYQQCLISYQRIKKEQEDMKLIDEVLGTN